MPSKRYGLKLTLGGAPPNPHVVAGLPGYYRPDVPTPVGGKNDALSLDEAKKAAKEIDVVELVELDADAVKAAEEQARDDVEAGRKGIVAARRDRPEGAEVSRAKDEQQAVKAAKEA